MCAKAWEKGLGEGWAEKPEEPQGPPLQLCPGFLPCSQQGGQATAPVCGTGDL